MCDDTLHTEVIKNNARSAGTLSGRLTTTLEGLTFWLALSLPEEQARIG